MNYLTAKKFSFACSGMTPDSTAVVRLTGTQALSRCYEFEITLICEDRQLDFGTIVRQPATLTFHRDAGDDVVFHGILLSFEQLQQVQTCAIYRAHLVPRLRWLAFTRHHQVFLDKTVPQIIEACLKDAGLTALDFELRIEQSYEPLEYVCQYGESHLDFVSRWCEREGIYYYFEQTDQGEKVIFTDTRIAHLPCPQGDTVIYAPPSGLEALHEKEVVAAFTCAYNLTPASVLLKDYNYRKPSLEISATAQVDPNGRGQAYHYGEHIGSPEQGERLAQIRAQSLLCRRERFEGHSAVPFVAPGFTVDLNGHYRDGFNQRYLVTEVRHQANQARYLVAGLSVAGDPAEPLYQNRFVAIPASLQYRPEPVTPKPRIAGSISARIDAAGSGQYAEIDEQGRYKVILPFDTSGRKNGKASAWIRMATPYAGADHGMHFPLHKNTEVLLTFIDGDPDRPVITAAVPNPEHPSPVTSANPTKSIITTASGNKIHIEDKPGNERILMHCPNQQSFVRIGAHNDPDHHKYDDEEGQYEGLSTDWEGIAEKTHGLLDIEAKIKNAVFLGESLSVIFGLRNWLTVGLLTEIVLGRKDEIQWPEEWRQKNFHADVSSDNWKAYASRAVANAVATHLALFQQQVAEAVTEVHGEEITSKISGTEVLAIVVTAASTDVDINELELENQENAIKAIGAHIQTIGNRLQNAGKRIKASGTSLKQSGVKTLNTAGNTVKTSGTTIKSGGVAIKSAPQIIEM